MHAIAGQRHKIRDDFTTGTGNGRLTRTVDIQDDDLIGKTQRLTKLAGKHRGP